MHGPVRLLVALLVGFPALASAGPSEEVFAKVSNSIVAVFTQVGNKPTGSFGSGVVVGNAEVVTNCHVIGQNAGVWIHHRGAYFRAESKASDPRRDLCLVSVPGLTAPSVKLASSLSLNQGERVWSLGAPKSLENVIGDGMVAGLFKVDDAYIIKTTTPAFKGSSGSGLFNSRSELVGLITSTSKSGANIQFAMPADWIKAVGKHQDLHGFQPPRSLLEDAVNIEAGNIDSTRVVTATNVTDDFFATTPKLESERFEKGKRFMSNSNWQQLKEHAEAWLSNQPRSVDAWMFLGHANVGLSDAEGMERAFKELLKLDPSIPQAHYYLGNAYLFQGKNQQALAEYRTAQNLLPHDQVFADALAWTERKLQRPQGTGKEAPAKVQAKSADSPPSLRTKVHAGPDKPPPGVGTAMVLLFALFLIAIAGIYVTFLLNTAQPWGTSYPRENRRGAAYLAVLAACIAFVPIYWLFF